MIYLIKENGKLRLKTEQKDIELVDIVFDYNDTTWEYDVHRDFINKETDIILSDVRKEYQEKLINYINWLNIPYTLVTGNYKEKIAKSRNHVYNLITN